MGDRHCRQFRHISQPFHLVTSLSLFRVRRRTLYFQSLRRQRVQAAETLCLGLMVQLHICVERILQSRPVRYTKVSRTGSLRAPRPARGVVCARRVDHLISTQVFLNRMIGLQLLSLFSVQQRRRIDQRLPLHRLPERTQYSRPQRLRHPQFRLRRHRARVHY